MRSAMLFGMIMLLAGAPAPASPGPQTLEKYDTLFAIGITPTSPPETCLVLRTFRTPRGRAYLGVDPATLTTARYDSAELSVAPVAWPDLRTRFGSSAYARALFLAERNDSSLQNAGITRFLPGQNGIDLTVDLCPSRRPLDRKLFIALFKEFGRVEKPVPVAVSVTGVWMHEHPDDLAWLAALVDTGDLAITWVNHSFHHYASKTLPLTRNFLLEKGTDMHAEILLTELALLEKGLLPSVFFRFPGLISDSAIFLSVIRYGIIPIGSDAWLAKNQTPGPGSIVLVHANGNEPVGIKRFTELMRQNDRRIVNKEWLLFDLRESLADEEGRNAAHPAAPAQTTSGKERHQ